MPEALLCLPRAHRLQGHGKCPGAALSLDRRPVQTRASCPAVVRGVHPEAGGVPWLNEVEGRILCEVPSTFMKQPLICQSPWGRSATGTEGRGGAPQSHLARGYL